jgi:hypothetical protein
MQKTTPVGTPASDIFQLRQYEQESFTRAERALDELRSAIERLMHAEMLLEAHQAIPVASLDSGTIWALVQNRRFDKHGTAVVATVAQRRKWLELAVPEQIYEAEERDRLIHDYEISEMVASEESL